jgi:4-amino-4-deoxy-L-arabinose transferase-like glycosyltransferase
MIIGYILTAAEACSFAGFLIALFLFRNEVREVIRPCADRLTIALLALIIAYFLIFSLLYVSPVEQLYFDENIYQGIAVNILSSGSSLWCLFGSGYLHQCYVQAVYHDPVGWSFFIAIAFALFGISTNTAFAMELLAGSLSILAVFLVSSALFKSRRISLISAFSLALLPGVITWSRTQASVDLPFMLFTLISLFFLAVFAERRSNKTFLLAVLSLVMVIYLRIEAILLLPVFFAAYFILGSGSIKENIVQKAGYLKRSLLGDEKFLLIVLALVMLLAPQIYYIHYELQNPNYGQNSSPLFSLHTMHKNLIENSSFLLGMSNFYPAIFNGIVTIASLLGIAYAVLQRKDNMMRPAVLSLGILFLFYMLFYASFYAGGANYGVDSRFMLELMPEIAIFSALGIEGTYRFISWSASLARRRRRARTRKQQKAGAMHAALYVLIVALFLLYPFSTTLGQITQKPQTMPQEYQPYSATEFIYNNYEAVPSNCLVFSFTPEMWYDLGRSSASISYIYAGADNQTIRNYISSYSCFDFDYGYWCSVPGTSSTCSSIMHKYSLTQLATQTTSEGKTFAIYRINNYSIGNSNAT